VCIAAASIFLLAATAQHRQPRRDLGLPDKGLILGIYLPSESTSALSKIPCQISLSARSKVDSASSSRSLWPSGLRPDRFK
jgi:hypothetical protein